MIDATFSLSDGHARLLLSEEEWSFLTRSTESNRDETFNYQLQICPKPFSQMSQTGAANLIWMRT